MNTTNQNPVSRSFDLGPNGFITNGNFVLAEGNWKNALQYANAAAGIDTDSIFFEDVKSFIKTLQSQTSTWKDNTYPNVVTLASDVYEYSTRITTYLKTLDKVLTALGKAPADPKTLKEVNAIIDALAPTRQIKTASAAIPKVQAFEKNAADHETKLKSLFIDYVTLYLEGQVPSTEPSLPQGLDQPIGKLNTAWVKLGNELENLEKWVNENAKNGTKFTADISLENALAAWKNAEGAADKWRINAYVGS